MDHPLTMEWDRRLKEIFDAVDAFLEEKYGTLYGLHPRRPKRGHTSNPEHDGLFNVGAVFSPGFGTRTGRGYLIDLDIATLDEVDPIIKEDILSDMVGIVSCMLSESFPDRNLKVERENNVLKITGDFFLGAL